MACTPIFTPTTIPTSAVGAGATPVPSGIVNNQVITFTGGQNYSGTLILTNLSGVTVQVTGNQQATITPLAGQPCISATGARNCTISGSISAYLVLRGGLTTGLNLGNATTCSAAYVAVFGASSYSIDLRGADKINVTRCWVDNGGSDGIGGGILNNSILQENTVLNCRAGGFTSRGIYIEQGTSNAILSNYVSSCTYHGISYLKPINGTIHCNLVEYSPSGADPDSGGIYTQHLTPPGTVNCRISGNTVTNITNGGVGIYLDDQSNDVFMKHNTIRSCSYGLIYHRATNCDFISNSCVDCGTVGIGFAGATGELSNNIITDNVFSVATGAAETFNFETGADIQTGPWATFDRNYYTDSNNGVFGRVWFGSGPATDYTYSQWKTYYGQDASSQYNNGTYASVIDTAASGPNVATFSGLLRKHMR